jgi:hypothetical protein
MLTSFVVVCCCRATQDDSDFMSLMMAAIGSRRTAIEYVSSLSWASMAH